jgi:hypothetical protein
MLRLLIELIGTLAGNWFMREEARSSRPVRLKIRRADPAPMHERP